MTTDRQDPTPAPAPTRELVDSPETFKAMILDASGRRHRALVTFIDGQAIVRGADGKAYVLSGAWFDEMLRAFRRVQLTLAEILAELEPKAAP